MSHEILHSTTICIACVSGFASVSIKLIRMNIKFILEVASVRVNHWTRWFSTNFWRDRVCCMRGLCLDKVQSLPYIFSLTPDCFKLINYVLYLLNDQSSWAASTLMFRCLYTQSTTMSSFRSTDISSFLTLSIGPQFFIISHSMAGIFSQ